MYTYASKQSVALASFYSSPEYLWQFQLFLGEELNFWYLDQPENS